MNLPENPPKVGGAQQAWSRRKKDRDAPRGIFRHSSGVWAIRYACSAGCAKHEERVGPLKSDAIRAYHDRRSRAHAEPGWCPIVERRRAREQARNEEAKQRSRVTFEQYAKDYLAWSGTVHRAQRTAKYEVGRLVSLLGGIQLDSIGPANIERCVRTLGETLAPASVNRLRDRLSGMFKRARRLALVTANPVSEIPKLKEAGIRLAFVSPVGEETVVSAMPSERRPLVILAANTGLRWSEQAALAWHDVDLLTGILTVRLGKNGQARRVPLNSAARSALMDLAALRRRPNDPEEPICRPAYRTVSREFVRAVRAAQGTLRASGREGEAARLDGVTWHALRHTFASRLVAAGVDLRTVQELGGWRTLSMVQRYAHLSPGHLAAAVERIVAVPVAASTELRQNFDSAVTASCELEVRH